MTATLPFLDVLCCPHCRADVRQEGRVLQCTGCHLEYPVTNGVARFVASDNYATSFGLQWNLFRKTQLDSFSGLTISRDRFERQAGWARDALRNALVLDVGCGAGRFTEIALEAGARVVAMDYSAAVDACRKNHEGHPNLMVVQADIYSMPFKAEAFDRVYCFGVLQHTPDVRRAFLALPLVVRNGGHVAVDVYPRLWMNVLWPKYWLRVATTRMRQDRLFAGVRAAVRWFWPLSVAVGRLPLVGRKLRYLIPIVNYEGVYPLSDLQLKEWAVLDTFDMLAPTYDQPQSADTLERWMVEGGLTDVEVFRAGFLVGRGRKKPLEVSQQDDAQAVRVNGDRGETSGERQPFT